MVTKTEELELNSLVEKCEKIPQIITVIEEASTRRFSQHRTKTFCSGICKMATELKGSSQKEHFVSAAKELWKYIQKHGMTDTMINRIKMGILLK